jgi:hypothetical protein
MGCAPGTAAAGPMVEPVFYFVLLSFEFVTGTSTIVPGLRSTTGSTFVLASSTREYWYYWWYWN